jgi:hypothetical protein
MEEAKAVGLTDHAVADTVAPVVPKAKRKYTKVVAYEFIRIANDSDGIQSIADKTGMSYAGVRFRIQKIRELAKKKKEHCPINPLPDGRLKK